MTLPPQLLQPLDITGAGEPQPQDETGSGALQPQDETGAGALQPQDETGAGALQPQDETGAGALQPQDETGALHVGTETLHVGAGALHVGAGVQHEAAGAQLDALPQWPPRPARNLPNRPACASDAEAKTTEQTTRLATKNRLIGTSLGKQFFNDQKGWPQSASTS